MSLFTIIVVVFSLFLVFLLIMVILSIVSQRRKMKNRSPEEKNMVIKIEKLINLRNSLESKLEQVNELKKQYQANLKEIVAEIKAEKKNNKISTFSQALENQRIRYDLTLIQKLKSKIGSLERLTADLSTVISKLEYLERDAKTDLKMIKTLGMSKVSEVADAIEEVLTKYSSRTWQPEETDKSETESGQTQTWSEISK